MTILPNNGGCWFCHEKNGDLQFCCEFDTYLHIECLLLAKQTDDPENRELQIMLREFEC